jgi:hypothetical protein
MDDWGGGGEEEQGIYHLSGILEEIKIEQEVLGRSKRLLSLIRHGPH